MRFFILIAMTLVALSCATSKHADKSSSETFEKKGDKDKKESVLIQVSDTECAYVNLNGDTIIAANAYQMCFADTIKYFGAFLTHDNTFVGVDPNNQVLFEIFQYDNGPDYISEGLFRIVLEDKIGYANERGEIVILPKYACAFPFENGKAKVALECTKIQQGEHTQVNAEKWIYIDNQGNIVE